MIDGWELIMLTVLGGSFVTFMAWLGTQVVSQKGLIIALRGEMTAVAKDVKSLLGTRDDQVAGEKIKTGDRLTKLEQDQKS